MNYQKILIAFSLSILTSFTLLAQQDPIADGQDKWLGNVCCGSQLTNFTDYWNQVTPENAGKWGSVEGTRDNMNSGGLNSAYNLAKDNGFPFRFHVLVWGNQQPSWIESLETAEQREEIEEWFQWVADNYPDLDYVEVVNEPLHDPPAGATNGNYIDALGGSGPVGSKEEWAWALEAFRLARDIFPEGTQLMINDYNIVNSTANTARYKTLIDTLQSEGLIDIIGVQCHAFSINTTPISTITDNLNTLASTGLPIQVTEMDIDGPTDRIHLQRYKTRFPAFWEHEAITGVTLWGWRNGMWRSDQMAYLIRPNGGTERPSLVWLRAYVEGTYVEPTTISVDADAETIEIGETLQFTATVGAEDATIKDVEWSVTTTSGIVTSLADIDEQGLLTAAGAGTVRVTATSIDDTGLSASMDIEIPAPPVTSLDEVNRFAIYPNPVTQGQFTIKGAEKYTRVKVIDMNGREMQSMNLGSQSAIDVKLDVNPGIYLVQLYDGQTYTLNKLIVK